MAIKAIIFDLDGTAIPNRIDGIPSERVIEAVRKAQKLIKVSIATGRQIFNCRRLIKTFNIDQPSIIMGGTCIINPKTEEILWKKEMSENQAKQIINICLSYSYQIYSSNKGKGLPANELSIEGPEQILYIMNVTPGDTKTIVKKLNNIPDIAVHEVQSWKQNHFDIHITHKDATKKHALEELLKIIDVDKDEVMAVGDSSNDMPLFEIAGFKVAMNNATEKLKQNADYITDSVENDGLAKVIEEKIL